MVSAKNMYLSFPVNTLNSLNFSVSNAFYYNLYFPQITSDNQLGAELKLLLANLIETTSFPNTTNKLYISAQGTNKFFPNNSLSSLGALSYYVFASGIIYAKFIAIKTTSGQYGWLEIS